jgi:hypothetical protein
MTLSVSPSTTPRLVVRALPRRTPPVLQVIRGALRTTHCSDYEVLDHPYKKTPPYVRSLIQGLRVVVLMPWMFIVSSCKH